MSYIKPYAAFQLVNVELVKAGIKPIRSQMLYNYTSGKLNKGEKPIIKFSFEEGVDREDLIRWLKEYINKKVNGPVVHEPLNLND